MVVWCTGLAGSGKTTLCQAILAKRTAKHSNLVLLDGDVIREVFGNDLGYTAADRFKQVSRIQRLAKQLSDQGLTVLVAALYSNEELLGWNRKNISNYFEVFVRTPMEILFARDQKGLYSGARAGRIKDVVGMDIPWSEPQKPDFVVDTTQRSPEEWAVEVIERVPALGQSLGFAGALN